MKQDKKNWLLIIATAVCLLIYAVWRLGFTLPADTVPRVCWIILTLVEFVGLFELAVFIYEYTKKKSVRLPDASKAAFPDVDVFVFTINEPEDLLQKTLFACRKMRYPDPQKIHVYLCDDGGRESMRLLSEKMGVNYLAREDHADAKAGNFNYALIKSRSPLIAIFDSDMMPKADFLMKTVPYFVRDKKVGFVQTPQHFYRKDIFQRALPKEEVPHNEQDYFYQIIQETKNSSNSVILAGSNTLLRRSAVEAIGGFVTGTVTEDFSTGIELEKNGYTGVSIDEVLADGLPPMDFGSFVKQRRRWARGCIQSGKKTKYLKSRSLSFRQKVNYFSSIVYWYSSLKRLIYMVAPMLFCLAGIGVMRCEPWEIALFWFPFYACVHLCIYNFSDKIRSLRWTNIYETVLMPFLLPAVFKELFGFHQTIFDVTSKKQEAGSRRQTARFLAPFVFLLLLNILSLALIILRSFAEEGFHYVLLVVYLLVNCYYLITACRVVTGSAKYTEDPMFGIQEAMQYRDDLEEDFVNIRSTALNEDRISTGTYDDKWTAGVMRIPAAGDRPQIDIPVRYEKNGVWEIDKDAAAFDNYNEYVYHIFNR